MKTNFVKTGLFALALAGFIGGCSNSDDYDTPEGIDICEDESVGLQANTSVADVYAVATAGAAEYEEGADSDYVEAYIVSSDAGGNFFKTISLQTADGSRAFSIAVDVYNTYTKGFEVGRKVLVRMDDLHIQIVHSSLAVGQLYTNPSTGAQSVGRIAEGDLSEIMFKTCEYKSEEELVQHLTIGQINNSHINKLIEFDNVEFVSAAVGKPYYDPTNVLGGATNHLLTDANGNTVIFRTGSFATYAGDIIPNKSGKVRGILTKFNSDFQFVARIASDIKLTEPRLADQEPEDPEDPEGPENPGPGALFVFPSGDFENYPAFIASLNSFGIKAYANESAGTGVQNGTSMHIATPSNAANDFVFTTLAHSGLPATYSQITFWVKGTSAKSISINLYKNDGSYYPFNLQDVTGNKTVSPAANNQYTGTINTNGEWVKITLDLAGITDLNVTNVANNFFALKIGSVSAYDLHLDNFVIE